MKTNLIGISGRIKSGKNTVATMFNELSGGEYEEKSFARKLKQVVSLLTGIPAAELEKQEVKALHLPEEWRRYRGIYKYSDKPLTGWCGSAEEVEDLLVVARKNISMLNHGDIHIINELPTYRQMLQEIGTDCLRNGFHPNIHLNALYADFNETSKWILCDCRFKNELDSIKERRGITIRVNRGELDQNVHESESALDLEVFDYTIDNSGDLNELREKVKALYETIHSI